MEPRPYGCQRRAILLTLGIILVVFACGTISLLGVDTICWNGLTQKLPIYPNATVTLQRHNFLRPFGMGETVMVLESDDPVETVREWYGRTVAEAARGSDNEYNPFYYIPSGRYSVTRAEDGSGTQIILNGVCVS
jgi:hypothetical protein